MPGFFNAPSPIVVFQEAFLSESITQPAFRDTSDFKTKPE